MKPFFVLLVVFGLSLLAIKIFRGEFDFALSGRIAMAVMLLFTAMGHFMFPKGMSMMIPAFVPFKIKLVYLTGIIEILFALALLWGNYRFLVGCLLIAFLILVLPANIYAAIKNVDYQQADFNGKGLNYLWIRIPLQIIYILWTWFFVVKAKA